MINQTPRALLAASALCIAGATSPGCVMVKTADAAISVGAAAVNTTARAGGAAIERAAPDGHDENRRD